MTQRPCRVGDTVRYQNSQIEWEILVQETVDAINSNMRWNTEWSVTRCGQCGKAVPSECRCVFEDSETGGE